MSCQNLAPFARGIFYATGGLVNGVPLICGGELGSAIDECYSITKTLSSLVTKMSDRRYLADSVVVQENTFLWILGGAGGSGKSTSEYISLSGSASGPNLPISVYGHAVVAWNSTDFMLMGGSGGSKTFYYNEDNSEWTPGPEMKESRARFKAGLGMDQATNDPYIAATGGVWGLDSVDLLYQGEIEWQAGKHQ